MTSINDQLTSHKGKYKSINPPSKEKKLFPPSHPSPQNTNKQKEPSDLTDDQLAQTACNGKTVVAPQPHNKTPMNAGNLQLWLHHNHTTKPQRTLVTHNPDTKPPGSRELARV